MNQLLVATTLAIMSVTATATSSAEPLRQSGALVTSASFRFDELARGPELPRQGPRVRPRPLRRPSIRATIPGEVDSTRDDAVLESLARTPGPIASFLALPDNDTTDPPDTNGAVGPSHLVTTLNSQVRIQDRTGVALQTMSIEQFVNPVAPGAFVSDPHITYDPFADRFLFTIAVFSNAGAGQLVIAATATGDPTATWNMFNFDDSDPNLGIDYPTLGFNKDWVVVDTDEFSSTDVTEHVWVFDKAKLYSGIAPTPTIFANIQDTTVVPAVTYDSTLPVVYLVSDYNGPSKQLHLYAVGNSSGTPTFTVGGIVTGPMAWDDYPQSIAASGAWAPQRGTASKLDPGDSRLMNAVWKNGALWTSHTAFVPAGQSVQHAVGQWWKITPGANVAQNVTPAEFGRIEDTSGKKHYCYTSIGVNDAGDVLLGGTMFSADTYPSSFIAFHGAADPPSSTRPSRIFKAGESFVAKGGGDYRWGDYSATVLDPDGMTFWSLQEYGASPQGGSRWGTWWAHVDPAQNLGGGSRKKGCSCDLSETSGAVSPGVVLVGLAAALLGRRRASKRNQRTRIV